MEENIQYSMLSLPDFNTISIYTYQLEILLALMLEDSVYTIRQLNKVKVEVIDKF